MKNIASPASLVRLLAMVGLVAVFTVSFAVATPLSTPLPPGAPPLATPPPPPGPTSGPFPGSDVTIVPEAVAVPVASVWEVDICHVGPGSWVVSPNPIVIQDLVGTDYIHFRLCANSSPPLGDIPPWSIYVVFGANPWNLAPPIAFRLSSIDPFVMSPPIPGLTGFPTGTYAFNLVLTDPANQVIDILDPLLIIGGNVSPQSQPVTLTDHFLCYEVEDSKGEERSVTIADQFGKGIYAAGRPTRVCTPASKNGEPIRFPTLHLTCYTVRRTDYPKPSQNSVITESQFGVERLRLRRPREICLPAFKVPVSGQ